MKIKDNCRGMYPFSKNSVCANEDPFRTFGVWILFYCGRTRVGPILYFLATSLCILQSAVYLN